MAFFRRELGPIERFENALKEKQAARQKLAERLSVAEAELAEKRAATERLAVAGAANARLDRAEAAMRVVEDRTKTMRAELLEFDEQVASAERALADAKAQRPHGSRAYISYRASNPLRLKQPNRACRSGKAVKLYCLLVVC